MAFSINTYGIAGSVSKYVCRLNIEIDYFHTLCRFCGRQANIGLGIRYLLAECRSIGFSCVFKHWMLMVFNGPLPKIHTIPCLIQDHISLLKLNIKYGIVTPRFRSLEGYHLTAGLGKWKWWLGNMDWKYIFIKSTKCGVIMPWCIYRWCTAYM